MGILKWPHTQYFGRALQLAVNKAIAIPAISRACVRGPCQPLPSFYQLVIPPDLEAADLEA